jgi:hypothetical protein
MEEFVETESRNRRSWQGLATWKPTDERKKRKTHGSTRRVDPGEPPSLGTAGRWAAGSPANVSTITSAGASSTGVVSPLVAFPF